MIALTSLFLLVEWTQTRKVSVFLNFINSVSNNYRWPHKFLLTN